MNIVIVGFGFVGKAVNHIFKDAASIKIIDPVISNLAIKDVLDWGDAYFICVPTPFVNNECDGSIVKDIVSQITSNATIIIKSTVTPNIIEDIAANNIVFNPEFLRAETANVDMENASYHILGGEALQCDIVEEIYSNFSICNTSNIIKTSPIAASMAKYTMNSFMATKVVWFNQIYDIFEKSNAGILWDEFVEILKNDKRMGDTHMNVPNGGKFGYGGGCFPKDMNALKSYGASVGSDITLIENVISSNKRFRSR